MKNTIFILLLLIFSTCKGPLSNKIEDAEMFIGYHNSCGNFCLQNQEIVFSHFLYWNDVEEIPSDVDVSYQWSFGDGEISNELSPTHTYQNTGTFLITLIIEYNGEELILEENVIIQKEPELLNETTNNLAMLNYQDAENYKAIVAEYTGLSVLDWYVISYNDSNELFLNSTEFKYNNIQCYEEGYLMVGFNSDKFEYSLLSNSGGLLDQIEYSIVEEGYHIRNISQLDNNEIFLFYIDNNVTAFEGRRSILRRVSIEGLPIWDKEYDFIINKIFKLSDGYILINSNEEIDTGKSILELTKINENGELIWSNEVMDLEFESDSEIEFDIFESDGGVVVAFDKMRGISFGPDGDLIYDKYYSFKRDDYHSAMENLNGNIVILGYRNSRTDVLNETGIIHVEISKDGNVIE